MYKQHIQHIHFVGIGGIGMSGIATILHHQGHKISGCDLDMEQKSVRQLQDLGCTITEGHNSTSCQDQSIDILVYSSAVKQSHEEIVIAQKRSIPTIPRALMLAELMRTKFSIAIAGAHGKTTTTSMISHMLIEAHMDPTVIIGGHLKNISTNAQFGEGDFLVAEADESDRSLLNLHATLAVITNIDLEHLDVYRDFDDIKETFKQFLNNLPFYGKAIVCSDDPGIQSLLPLPHIKTIKYGLDGSKADIWADELILEANFSTCRVWHGLHALGTVKINMPGKHNILNALATIALGLDLEIPFAIIMQSLENFKGIERRFSFHGTFQGAEIFDDYGHHPNEILNTLLVARKRTKKKLRVIFQPHRYTRTQKLWDQFIKTFIDYPVDELVITDIYPASETPIEGVISQKFVEALQKACPNYPVTYMPFDKSFKSFIDHIATTVQEDDLVLLLGAGKVNQIAAQLIKQAE